MLKTSDRSLPPQWLLLTILAGLGMVGPFSIDTMFPAFTEMAVDLDTTPLALQQLISVYLLSFAVMSLFHGPLSDAVGRKPVILVGSALFVLSSLACALAPSLPLLLVGRAAQGVSAGAGQIISRAMVRDVFADARAQQVMSQIAMIFGLAPALAPIMGGWLLAHGDWRLIFWFLTALGVVLLLLVWLLLPETHPEDRRTPLQVGPLFASLWAVWRDPNGRRLALTGMVNFGGMFVYISAAPYLVVTLLGMGEQDFWVLFVPLISGMVIGSWFSGRLAGRMNPRRMTTLGYWISLAGGATNLALMLLPAAQRLPWAVLLLPVITFGVALAFPVLTLAMLDLFPASRGAAGLGSELRVAGSQRADRRGADPRCGVLTAVAGGCLVVPHADRVPAVAASPDDDGAAAGRLVNTGVAALRGQAGAGLAQPASSSV
ncbi:multidrug effflux MFS transporter [Micropruina sp.]|uniref:multidrug effflux MFS transporter n=1 Tax=Micropruina sp. TaxID=2737536 RepID=UPI0039E4EEB7